jgi:hypothetical protein
MAALFIAMNDINGVRNNENVNNNTGASETLNNNTPDTDHIVDDNTKTWIYTQLSLSHDKHFETVKRTQIDKFDRLASRHKAATSASSTTTTVDKTRWVINKSSRPLSTEEQNILEKGLNFAISDRKLPIKELIISTEEACAHMGENNTNKDLLRAEIVQCLSRAKPPKPNITSKERSALEGLRKDDKIIILPADKGRATVIMNKTEYKTKMTTLLSDTATYQKLKADPTGRKLVAMLQKWQRDDPRPPAPVLEDVPYSRGTSQVVWNTQNPQS